MNASFRELLAGWPILAAAGVAMIEMTGGSATGPPVCDTAFVLSFGEFGSLGL